MLDTHLGIRVTVHAVLFGIAFLVWGIIKYINTKTPFKV